MVASQEAGLKVKEFELLRRNFSDSGNFGAYSPQDPVRVAPIPTHQASGHESLDTRQRQSSCSHLCTMGQRQ